MLSINSNGDLYNYLRKVLKNSLRNSTATINDFNKPIGRFRLRSLGTK